MRNRPNTVKRQRELQNKIEYLIKISLKYTKILLIFEISYLSAQMLYNAQRSSYRTVN